MIAYLFLGVGGLGTGGVVIAVRYGYGPVEATRKAIEGSGLRRITARQLRHELRQTDHQLAGARQYIAGLERDRGELSALLEQSEDRHREQNEGLRQEITELRAALDNARAMRQLHPGPSPADEASALPDSAQEFADQTALAWRASA
ncbi:hypothetical protein ACF06P_35730 [Streptomyces sp. NPDC015684]|uniref:hypothetical protein n=1 Tax=Streptomyces sp. NPDC015684 TaxID=3364963 RepID=UPI0036F9932D